MEREATGPGYKMKGHTLPGINQRSEKSKSSTFQFGNAMMGMTAGAGNMAQSARRRNVSPQGPAGGVGTPLDPSVLVSKPSMAKIYSKAKGKRTEY